MTKTRQLILSSFLFFGVLSAYAQDSTVVQDFEIWSGVELHKSFLEKKLELALTQEFRLEDNATSINNFFTEFQVEYKLIDDLSLGAGYRFIRNNRKGGYRSEGRFFFDVNYKHKIDRLKLSYRFRYQHQNVLGDAADDDVYNKYRLRVKLDYNIPKWKFDPYVSAEAFYSQTTNSINYIESITETERFDGFQKLRFTIGTSYDFNKVISLGAYYRYERELGSFPLNYNTPRNFYIVGLNLKFEF